MSQKKAPLKDDFGFVPDEEFGFVPDESPSPVKEVGKSILSHGMKLLDFGGGAVRSGIGHLIPDAQGKPLVSTQEVLNSLNPVSSEAAPNTSEIMRRAGVSEGAKLSDYLHVYADPGSNHSMFQPEKGGMLDPSMRGTVGLAGDIATDPLTYLTRGATGAERALTSEAALAMNRGTLNRTWTDWLKSLGESLKSKANPIVRPGSNTANYVGTKMYRGALKPLDQEMVDVGKPLLSPRLQAQGVTGGWQAIDQHMLDRSQVLKNQALGIAGEMDHLDPVIKANAEISPYGDVMKEASATGGVNLDQAMNPARESIARMDNRPIMAPIQESVQELIDQHAGLGNVPRKQAVQLKSDLYSTLPDSTFDLATKTPPGAAARAQMARGIREGVEMGPTPQVRGLGEKLHDVNAEWGQYLDAKDKAHALAVREMSKPPITQVDSMLYGKMLGGHGGLDTGWGNALLAKKAQQTTMAPGFRTSLGAALNKMGSTPILSPLMDAVIRQKMLDDSIRQDAPWSLMDRTKLGGM